MAEAESLVLVIDDTAANRRLLAASFRAEGFAVALAENGADGLQAIEARRPSVVLLDLRMPGMDGLEVLARARAIAPELPIIMLTADGDIPSAVEATRRGAFDFLVRPVAGDKLILTVRHALEMQRLSGEVRSLRRQRRLTGSSEPMRAVARQIEQVAPSELTVLIQGETGTGKELAARAVHDESARSGGPFVALDCGAIPEALLESELFGYEKGAFTGASQRRDGYLVHARGGSLFLDEIGNLQPATQAKLLRVLQERQVQPVGGARPVAVDVRFIAATNEALAEQVEAGRFREDLYFRLAEFVLTLPPLRERGDDILTLANQFREEACLELRRNVSALTPAAAELLAGYAWPGNVRELRNVIRQAVLQSASVLLDADELRPLLRRRGGKNGAPATLAGRTLKEISEAATAEAERQAIVEALRACHGNKSRAARLLTVDFKTLHLKMKRFGLRPGPG